MGGWIDDLAEALEVDPLTASETDRLLSIARDVAHRVERRDTPLASFLLGMDVARRTADGSLAAMPSTTRSRATKRSFPPASERP